MPVCLDAFKPNSDDLALAEKIRQALPDFAADTSPVQVVEALKTRGLVLLRQVLEPALLLDYLPCFEDGFAAEDRRYISGQMPPETYQNLYRYGHVEPNQVNDYYAWICSILQTSPLNAYLQALYGPEAYLLVNNVFPRRQDPSLPEFAIPFHQDQEFTGPFASAINLWLPLTPVGQDFPSLELCLDGPQQPLLRLSDSEQERQDLLRRLDLARWQIEMQPGDALLFTGFTLHRTWMTESMTQVRYSAEIRLIAAADTHLTQTLLLRQNLNEC